MGLTIKNAFFINRAPFKNLRIDLKEQGINVLSAINGRGKTTILSHIVDAFHEMARPNFTNSYEGKENKFYRFSSSIFCIDQSMPSLVYLRFNNGIKNIDYIDCRGAFSKEQYDEWINLEDKVDYKNLERQFNKNGITNIKEVYASTDEIVALFRKNVMTYFPAYRYERPYYLNDPYKTQYQFDIEQRFSQALPNPIEVISGLSQLANWIMDVVLDKEVYRQTQEVTLEDGRHATIDLTPERQLYGNLNKILNLILIPKYHKGKFRFGIGRRHTSAERIAIMEDLRDSTSIVVSPSIFCLSSGEVALLTLFGEILRQGDNLQTNVNLKDIRGIVLIDEIDKHLHIKLQKEVLPELIMLFPNVQFIVSSHSPFLNMGLSGIMSSYTQIIDLDNHGVICEPTHNDLYNEVYEMMISENEQYAKKYNDLVSQINNNTKPIIVTEGKTDYRHIKNAIKVLGITDVNVDFYTVPDKFGDSQLKIMLDNLSTIKQKNIVIGIFDRDSKTYLDYVDAANQQYKTFGDSNVYAFAIPLVNSTLYGDSISIEHYYRKEDLLKEEDSTHRRLFLGQEFHHSGNSIDGQYQTKISNIQNKVKINGIIDDKVFEASDLENKTNVALTKNAFTDLIETNPDYTKDFDFSNFNKIIDIIRIIIANPLH